MILQVKFYLWVYKLETFLVDLDSKHQFIAKHNKKNSRIEIWIWGGGHPIVQECVVL